MTLFLTASSFYSIFTQVPKTFNSTVALQVGLLKHLGNVATVLLDLVCLSLFCFLMSFHTLCGALAVVSYIYIQASRSRPQYEDKGSDHDFSQF